MATWEPQLGDSGWEVEWCSHLPVNEFGDADIDRAKYHRRYFQKRDAAFTFARQVLSKDVFGSVIVTPFAMEPLCNTWPYGKTIEYTADAEYVE